MILKKVEYDGLAARDDTAALKELASLSKNLGKEYGAGFHAMEESAFASRTLADWTRVVDSEYRRLRSQYSKLKKMAAYVPSARARYSESDVPPSMHIYCENGLYHYVLDDLLPHRTSSKHPLDRDLIYSGYRRAIDEFSMEHKFILFPRKILLLFVNYYGRGNQIDHDNLDAKAFIDCAINGILIPDDAPDYLDICFVGRTGMPDISRHTEAYAGEYGKVLDILHGMTGDCSP